MIFVFTSAIASSREMNGTGGAVLFSRLTRRRSIETDGPDALRVSDAKINKEPPAGILYFISDTNEVTSREIYY